MALGTAQTIAWASTYYLPAVLATPIARDLGLSPTWVFAAFSLAMVISAIIGPRGGRRIDHLGGRSVLVASNIILALGLILLANAQGPVSLVKAPFRSLHVAAQTSALGAFQTLPVVIGIHHGTTNVTS